jgi:hypothetical protein
MPGAKQFEVSARSSATRSLLNWGRSLVACGGGSSDSLGGMGSGLAAKNLFESVWEISVCSWTRTPSE